MGGEGEKEKERETKKERGGETEEKQGADTEWRRREGDEIRAYGRYEGSDAQSTP